jgi:hypothetical protein
MLGNCDVWETCNWNCDVSLCFVILEFSDIFILYSFIYIYIYIYIIFGLRHQRNYI